MIEKVAPTDSYSAGNPQQARDLQQSRLLHVISFLGYNTNRPSLNPCGCDMRVFVGQ